MSDDNDCEWHVNYNNHEKKCFTRKEAHMSVQIHLQWLLGE